MRVRGRLRCAVLMPPADQTCFWLPCQLLFCQRQAAHKLTAQDWWIGSGNDVPVLSQLAAAIGCKQGCAGTPTDPRQVSCRLGGAGLQLPCLDKAVATH